MIDNSHMIDTLTEFINIGTGKAANALNMLFGTHIKLRVPTVNFTEDKKFSTLFKDSITDNNLCVSMNFTGDISGSAFLLFDLNKIGPLMEMVSGGTQQEDMTSFHSSVLIEVGNIVINAIVGSISNMVHAQVDYSVPMVVQFDKTSLFDKLDSMKFVLRAVTTFNLEKVDFATEAVLLFETNEFAQRFAALLD